MEISFEKLEISLEMIISKNPNITINFIKKFSDKLIFDTNCISSNPSLTIEIIEKYLDKQLSFGKYGISSNPHITLEFIEKYFDKLDLYSGISLEFIEKHDKKFNWSPQKVYLIIQLLHQNLSKNILINLGIGNVMVFQQILVCQLNLLKNFQIKIECLE